MHDIYRYWIHRFGVLWKTWFTGQIAWQKKHGLNSPKHCLNSHASLRTAHNDEVDAWMPSLPVVDPECLGDMGAPTCTYVDSDPGGQKHQGSLFSVCSLINPAALGIYKSPFCENWDIFHINPFSVFSFINSISPMSCPTIQTKSVHCYGPGNQVKKEIINGPKINGRKYTCFTGVIHITLLIGAPQPHL